MHMFEKTAMNFRKFEDLYDEIMYVELASCCFLSSNKSSKCILLKKSIISIIIGLAFTSLKTWSANKQYNENQIKPDCTYQWLHPQIGIYQFIAQVGLLWQCFNTVNEFTATDGLL